MKCPKSGVLLGYPLRLPIVHMGSAFQMDGSSPWYFRVDVGKPKGKPMQV